MTAQEIFNTVWAAMIAQGEQSRDGGACLYRGPQGLKCAVGHLLTDDEARAVPNGSSVLSLYADGFLPERLHPHIDLLIGLQRAHDHEAIEDEWLETFKKRARRIANGFNLTVPE